MDRKFLKRIREMIFPNNLSVQNELSVLLIPLYDREWASSRYRLYNYIPMIENSGIRCKVISPPQRDFVSRLVYLIDVIFKARKVDVVFIQKKIFRKAFVYLLHKFNSNIVFDFDDALFARPTSVDTDEFDTYAIRQSLNYVLRKSKKVIVGNQFLKDYVVSVNPDVHIVPTPVHSPQMISPTDRSPDKVVMGWIGNRENLIYLRELENVFRQLTSSLKDRFALKVICDEPLYLEGINIINKQWVLQKEFDELADIDIGIMPLKDDDWSKGKCAFKLLQFMGMGIPVVASPIGMNNEVIKTGVNGYLAETEEEWVMQISRLIADSKLRIKFGSSGKKLINSKYCYNVTAPLLAKVFKECLR